MLLKAYIHRVTDVNAERRDAPKPESLVKGNRLWLPNARREPKGAVTQLRGLALQPGQQEPSDSLSPHRSHNIHSPDLCSLLIQRLQGGAGDRLAAKPGDEVCAPRDRGLVGRRCAGRIEKVTVAPQRLGS